MMRRTGTRRFTEGLAALVAVLLLPAGTARAETEMVDTALVLAVDV